MAMSTEELEGWVREHLSDDLLRRSLRGVFAGYKDSREKARELYADTEVANVVGFMRRASVEANLRSAAEMTAGVEVATVHGPDSNWNHVEVRSGPVVLTESSVPYPCSMVDRSNFRATLAEPNTLSLFDIDDPKLSHDDADRSEPEVEELYVLLLHSKYRGRTPEDVAKYGHLPGSAYIACPTPEFRFYLCEINLFELFPDVVAAQLPNEWNEEAVVEYRHNSRKASWSTGRRAAS